MALLQSVSQHRTVLLGEDVAVDLDDQIRSNPEDVPIERGVMDLLSDKPFGTTGSPSGSVLATMWAASRSSPSRRRQIAHLVR